MPKSLINILDIGKEYEFLIENKEYKAKLTRIAPMSEKRHKNKLGLFEFNDFFNPGATARLILSTTESKKELGFH